MRRSAAQSDRIWRSLLSLIDGPYSEWDYNELLEEFLYAIEDETGQRWNPNIVEDNLWQEYDMKHEARRAAARRRRSSAVPNKIKVASLGWKAVQSITDPSITEWWKDYSPTVWAAITDGTDDGLYAWISFVGNSNGPHGREATLEEAMAAADAALGGVTASHFRRKANTKQTGRTRMRRASEAKTISMTMPNGKKLIITAAGRVLDISAYSAGKIKSPLIKTCRNQNEAKQWVARNESRLTDRGYRVQIAKRAALRKRAASLVTIIEDNAGQFTLSDGNVGWQANRYAGDPEQALAAARDWQSGEWEPNESDGWHLVDLADLDPYAAHDAVKVWTLAEFSNG